MNFSDACIEARKNDDLVRGFNRLGGHALRPFSKPLGGIEQMIDDATGRTEASEKAFIRFFDECVWSRLPDECFELEVH